MVYPSPVHPAGRHFCWERERVLPALQLVAIRSGAGEIEWTRERHRLGAGSIFLLLPGQWHRYRPDIKTGWTEDWFELRGETVEKWMLSNRIARRVFKAPTSFDFFQEMDELHLRCSGRRRISVGHLAGRAMALFSEVLDFSVEHGAERVRAGHREPIAAAREHSDSGTSAKQTAAELGISYPTLHRIFKKLTGIAPKASAEKLKMARAEAFLTSNQLSMKEIAAELGFNSANHFLNTFKKVYGRSPSQWLETFREVRSKL